MAHEFQNMGQEIRDAVMDAVNSGDYSQLNRRITGSVSVMLAQLNTRLQKTDSGKTQPRTDSDKAQTPPKAAAPSQAASSAPLQTSNKNLFSKRPAGSISGPLNTLFGGIMTLGFGSGLLFSLVFVITQQTRAAIAALSVFAILTALSVALYGFGRNRWSRLRRFRRYVAALDGKQYIPIDTLAEKTQRSEAFVRKDLRGMIQAGMFLQGHLDEDEKTLLVTDAGYAQYLELKRQREALAKESAAQTEQERLYQETAEQGRQYLTAIRKANDAIPGEAVSEKLDRLENIVRKIFEQVHLHPQQLPELRRFLAYYMPMTQKLVETYEELDRHPEAGENIRRAKTEIENSLDTINSAFENLFDRLFAQTRVDITSDISALEAMLRQEGLSGSDFSVGAK